MTTMAIIITTVVILLFIGGTMFRINLKHRIKQQRKKTTENFRNFNQ
jgi:hypothetical protein